MAARRDEWIEVANKKRAADLPELFKTLTTVSRPATQRRLNALTNWPRNAALGKHVTELLRAFPFDVFELGGATRALGLAILQGAGVEAFEETKLTPESKGVNDWRGPALEAAKRFVARTRSVQAEAKPFKAAPIPLKPRKALQAAWLELAASRNPDALPQLLERLGEGPSTDLCARGLELMEFPRDSRVADTVEELLLYPTVVVKPENPVFLVQGLLLSAHGDKKHGSAIKALVEKIPALEWLPLPQDTSKKVKRKPAPKVVDEASFIQSIAEDPTDLSRRMVFADWLTERGDPRGEFITLQLAASKGALEPKAAARMESLQTKHASTWLRTIDRSNFLKGKEVFEDGFLAQVNFRLTDFVPKATDPVLATIKRLSAWGGEGPRVDALMGSPFLSQVRDFSGTARMFAALCPAALEKLQKVRFEFQTRAEFERLLEVKTPALETVFVDKRLIDGYDAGLKPDELFALPLFGSVKHLELTPTVDPGTWLSAALEKLKLETCTIYAPTQFRYVFDLKSGTSRVRPSMFIGVPDDSDLARLLIRPLATLWGDIRKGMTVELPAGYTLPEHIADEVRGFGLTVIQGTEKPFM